MDADTNRTLAEVDAAIAGLMRHGGPALVIRSEGAPSALTVVPLTNTGGKRPDGLRDDAPADAGFGFEVAHVALEVAGAQLSRAQLEAVHDVLFVWGCDDWMDYSHLTSAQNVPDGAELGIRFSSAPKGASMIVEVLRALQVPLGGVDVVRA
jgi:hypothetical protein